MPRPVARIGIGLAATALIAVSFFGGAVAASADEPVLTPAPTGTAPLPLPLPLPLPDTLVATPVLESDTTTFAAGDWGDGITATGGGYIGLPDGSTLTIIAGSVAADGSAGGPEYGEIAVTPDAAGTVSISNWIPENLATTLPAGFEGALFVILDQDGNPTTTDDRSVLAGLELTITPFAPLPQSLTITPACSTIDGIATDGIHVKATGFGQFETLTESTVGPSGEFDVAGDDSVTDGTGSVEYDLQLTSGVQDGEYTHNLLGQTSGVSLSTIFTVGDCTAPADTDATPVDTDAAPTLANTGSSDSAILIGGSVLALLAGGALVIARRRTTAAK
jgi:LPXTG-motif cell wall-anchored protein